MSRWFLRGAATVGGVAAVGIADRALAPRLKPPKSTIRIYQYDICPFCNKVKALLDLHKARPRSAIQICDRCPRVCRDRPAESIVAPRCASPC